jgi:hypothetical protein
MLTDTTQRWRDGKPRYRPAGEPIRTTDFDVAKIPGDAVAKSFVCSHHYSGSYPAARVRVGLYRRGDLVGVAVFSIPAQSRALDVLPGDAADKVELGRFVLLDNVPSNGESWFIARCFDLLRADGYTGVVSFSDPVPRSVGGDLTFPGHVGTIYQATNATYLGRSAARRLRLLPDGSVLHERAMAKVRRLERGHAYVEASLVRHGAEPRGEMDPAAWLRLWVPRLAAPLRHGGNHKYAWTLHKRDRRHLPTSLPYPKFIDKP